MLLNVLSALSYSFRDLLFPPLCIHCKKTVLEKSSYLCTACVQMLEFINPAERCPHCFSNEYSKEKKLCGICQSKGYSPFLKQSAAAFDYAGPPASIIRALKYGNQPYLSKGAGAYLVAQLLQLEWPLPDLLVPVPLSFTHWLNRGYNQSKLLAENMGSILKTPLNNSLKRRSGDYSQAGLDHKQRAKLTTNSFYLVDGHKLSDKKILLIDDVATTGATLEKCAEVLCQACPQEIYCLTFCRA